MVGPVQAVIERTVSGLGYELVEAEIAGRGLLRVTIDLPACAQATDPARAADALPPSVRVEDCEKVSHQLSHVLTVENVDYARLEVSSPGLDRPLKRPSDYLRFEGERVALRLREPLAGRRHFEGVLVRDEAEVAPGAPARWALELSDPEAPVARRPGSGLPVNTPGKGRAARGRATAAVARAAAAQAKQRVTSERAMGQAARASTGQAPADAGPAGVVETVRRLSFTLDEVERARLVPTVKF